MSDMLSGPVVAGRPADETVDVIDQLMADHLAILNATTPLRSALAAGQAADVAGAVGVIHDLLRDHLPLERALYAVLRERPEFAETVAGLERDLARIDDHLAALWDGQFADAAALVPHLRAHMDAEDDGLFAAARAALRPGDWARVRDLARAEQARSRRRG